MKLSDHFKRIPEHVKQTQEFRTLRELVRQKKIGTATQFVKYVQSEMETCKNSLKSLCNVSTNNRKRVELSKEISFLKTIQEKVLPYL